MPVTGGGAAEAAEGHHTGQSSVGFHPEGEPRVGGGVRRQQSKEQADRRWELILGCHGENLGFLGGWERRRKH